MLLISAGVLVLVLVFDKISKYILVLYLNTLVLGPMSSYN